MFKYIIPLIIAIFLSSCGSDDFYTVEGQIQGIGTRNLRLYYYDDNGLKVGVISALDGRFTFRGNAKETTLLSIATNQRGLITTVAVKNGDYIKLEYTINEPWTLKAEGNSINDALTSFVHKNEAAFKSGKPAEINAAVEKYALSEPEDITTAVITALYYNSALNPEGYMDITEKLPEDILDENVIRGYLLTLNRVEKEKLAKKVTPMTFFCDADSLTTFSPADYPKGTLIVINDRGIIWQDSLNRLVDKLPDGTGILNISLQQDTALWHAALRTAPPARAVNVWTPGFTSSPRLTPLSPITSLPEFVAVSPDGTKLYQGPSATEAVKKLN